MLLRAVCFLRTGASPVSSLADVLSLGPAFDLAAVGGSLGLEVAFALAGASLMSGLASVGLTCAFAGAFFFVGLSVVAEKLGLVDSAF